MPLNMSFEHLKAGIIGFGSVGKRHCANLLTLGVKNITLYRENGKGNPDGFKEVYDKQEFIEGEYDLIVLANPTALHFQYLQWLMPLQVNLLVEKPLVATPDEYIKLKEILTNYHGTGMCAFNMRFHPCVKEAEKIINENRLGKIYSARFFVGQYLPDWRPGTDYRRSYSSRKDLGGGVVLDLIHEIDLAARLCGPVNDRFHAMTGKVSSLGIETEDQAEIHYCSSNGAFISIHLDYLVRGYSRYFEIVGEKARLCADLSENRIRLTGDRNEVLSDLHFAGFDRNDMYLALMLHYLESVMKRTKPIPSLEEGMVSMETALRAKSE